MGCIAGDHGSHSVPYPLGGGTHHIRQGGVSVFLKDRCSTNPRSFHMSLFRHIHECRAPSLRMSIRRTKHGESATRTLDAPNRAKGRASRTVVRIGVRIALRRVVSRRGALH